MVNVGTSEFCRVTIPKDLLYVEDSCTVLVGSESVDYNIVSDECFAYVYFA